MQEEGTRESRSIDYRWKNATVLYDGFRILRASLTASRRQLHAFNSHEPVQKQFIGTLADTEAATGYFLNKARDGKKPAWLSYFGENEVQR